MRLKALSAVLVTALAFTTPLVAEEYYFVTSVNQLVEQHPELATKAIFAGGHWQCPATYPRILFEGDAEAEAYLCDANGLWQGIPPDRLPAWQSKVDLPAQSAVIAVRASQPTVRCQLLIAHEMAAGEEPVPLTLTSDRQAGHRELFLLAKRAHYISLWSSDIPGGAWFRHQVRQLEQELGADQFHDVFLRRRFFGNRSSAMESTYAFMSGGRAISENLQLDREFMERGQSADTAPTVPMESLTGITIREFDWKPLILDQKPETDPLAELIPADQHAVFFPNFSALVRFADDTTNAGTPILRFGEPRAEDARTRERYEQQLGLSLNKSARLFGPALIRSIALTGGDMYLRTGSDIAVLFEAANTEALQAALQTQIAATAGAIEGAAEIQGDQHGIAFRGYVTPDRRVSSYMAVIGDAVVVSNSLVQLERIQHASQNPDESLASLDEYTFFRNRYPRGDGQETALAVISDPTIRRWCGPKWRIATSRRTRATAVMAELKAQYLHQFVANNAVSRSIESPFTISDAKEFLVHSDGLRSEIYGNLDFQTPISELDFANVTPEEAEQYRRWRDGYQSNWSRFFDPIAIRFGYDKQTLQADVTVMPLIDASQYNFLINLTRGAKLDATSGDPHADALLQWIFALNTGNQQTRSFLGLTNIIGISASSWVGDSVSVYVDDDPVWRELIEWRKAHPDEHENEMVEQFLHKFPVAVHIESSNGLKLTAFLAALRAYVDQTAPGMTVWEVRQHGEEPYVRISRSERAMSQTPIELSRDLAIYYAANGEGLTVTMNEELIKRALDRQRSRRETKKEGGEVQANAEDLIGESVMLDVKREAVEMLTEVAADEYQQAMQRLCWNNLPILNEWKRHFPDQDPVQLHERHWGIRLVCPGGGEFRWNDAAQTFESSVYGHPGAPKIGPNLPDAFRDIASARFGLSIEENGIRARVQLRRAEKPESR